MWFTPTDFFGYDAGNSAPAPLAISNTRLAGYGSLTGSTFGPGLYDRFAEGQLVAMKLLPKGFSTFEEAIFFFEGVPAWAASCAVYANDLSTNSLINSIFKFKR